jgi:hypothetical protein
MTPEILREGTIAIIVAEVGSGEAGGAAATSGRSEPCFACRTSRFDFLETPIFLPNKISCKDNMPLQKCIGFARRERSWDFILLKKWGSDVPVLALLARLLVSPPDEMRWSEK